MTPDTPFALTLTQSDIYFDQLHRGNSPLYNVGGYIRMGKVDLQRMALAHRLTVAQNDAFGIRILAGPEICQEISSERDESLPALDFSGRDDPAGAAHAWLRTLFETPLPLHGAELFRAYLLRISQHEYWYVGLAHHIAMDGWGFANWARCLGEHYHRDEVAAPGLPWRAVVETDQAYAASSKIDADRAYWLDCFDTVPDKLVTPAAGSTEVRSARKSVTLSTEQEACLRRTAEDIGVGIPQVLLGLLATCLYAMYGRTDFSLGLPIHNRNTYQQKQTVGVFTSISPLRIRIKAEESFAELVLALARQQRRAFRHQRFPLGHLVRALSLSGSAKSLYDVAFNYLKLDSSFVIDGVPAKLCYLSHYHEPTPLMFTVWEYGQDAPMELQLDHHLAYFSPAEVDLVVGRMLHLIDTSPSLVSAALSRIDCLPPEEKAWLATHACGEADVGMPALCMHELFERQARTTPDAIAVRCGQESLSYQELNQRANSLAHRLRQGGAGPGAIIGVRMQRSCDMVVALMAVLKSGAAYLPLDPAYPPARVAFMAADAGVRTILTQSCLLDADTVPGVEHICLDQASVSALPGTRDLPASEACVGADDLAYIIYTSGSTGQPKGVAIRHRNAVALLAWAAQAYSKEELRAVLASTSLNFDLSVFEVFVPLSHGHTCVIVRDALALTEEPQDVSLINTVPSAMKILLAQGAIPASTQVINLAGEPLTQKLLNGLFDNGVCTRVCNLYGPSEDTTYSTRAVFTGPVDAIPDIGRAISNTRLYVLSPHGMLMPIGAAGELYIGGAGVAQGYLKRPELSAAKFLPDPFDSTPGGRLYRTGDLVRWEGDGRLAFLGRMDDQVKIRGFRIELGEVEAQLSADPRVREAVVVAGAGEDMALVAYVVPNQPPCDDLSDATLVSAIRARMKGLLADYMLPSAYVILESLPLSPNGKIDKAALPLPDFQAGQEYVAPVTPTEQALATIWQELLQLERVSTNANFFEIGGHSLHLTTMIHRAAQRCGLVVELRDVFQAPTISGLSALVDMRHTEHGVALRHEEEQQTGPLSFAQQRIWIAEQIRGSQADYNIVGRACLQGRFSQSCLQEALRRVVQRQPILRTCFADNEEGPYQLVKEEAPDALEYHDLCTQLRSERDVLPERIFEVHAAKTFKLGALPLFSLSAVQDEEQCLLQFNMHHIIADGWSLVLFFDELVTALDLERAGTVQAASLPLPYTYLDTVAWQRRLMQTSRAAEQQAFWRAYLDGCSQELRLPFQKSTPAAASVHGQVIRKRIAQPDVAGLRNLAQMGRGSMFNVLHAGLALLLSRLVGETDLNIGIPVAGRNLPGTERIMGMFLNNLPVRSRIDGNQSFSDLLHAQVKNVESVLSNQELPFEKILEVAAHDREGSGSPLFQVFLNMLSLPESSHGSDIWQFATDHIGRIGNKFNLSLYVRDAGESIELLCSFDENLLEQGQVELLVGQYADLLHQVAQDPARKCADYSLCFQGAAAQVTPDWSQPLASQWTGAVQGQFERAALRWPDRCALEFMQRQWSYQDLQRAVRHYARQLHALGVQAGDVVAIMAERDDSLIIAILATLSSGAAFMMLATDAPEQRLLAQLQSVPPACLISLTIHPELGAAIRRHLDESSCAQLHISADHRAFGNEYDGDIAYASGPDELAYIAFTSGTEGRPKAIRGRHSSLAAFLPWVEREFGLNTGERFGMLSGLVHDPLQRDIFTALCSGSTLVIPRAKDLEFSALNLWMAESRLTTVGLTPSLAMVLANVCEGSLATLRLIFIVGEVLTRMHVTALHRMAPQMRIINLYGATETGRAVGFFEPLAWPDSVRYSDDIVPVGKGIDGVQVLVLNKAMRPCGVGELGQIAIRSHFLSLGYHGQDAHGLGKFLRNPGTDIHGDMIYLTGDRGRYRIDGAVECLGRLDRQLKLRGFRIEPAEIQACLCAHPHVREAVVEGWQDADGLVIAAYLTAVPHVPAHVDDGALRDWLLAKLPEYMVPSEIYWLPEIPLNRNGKVDRTRLPRERPVRTRTTMAVPANDLERELLSIWHVLLKRTDIGVDEDFFRLGGHSLLATQLFARIKQQFSVELKYRDFFETSSVRAVARQITATRLMQGVTRSNKHKQQLVL